MARFSAAGETSQLDIARGAVPGMVSINKFGRNIEIDSGVVADIWDGGYTLASGGTSLLWVQPTQARVHAIVSDSVEDSDTGGVVAQGDGARTVRVYGLTSWSTKEVSEDVTLDGTTAVNTANAYVIIHRVKVLTKGNSASGPNVGEILVTAAGDSSVTAMLYPGQGQTQMAVYGIPSVQTAYMTSFYGNINKAGGAAGLIDMSLRVNPNPDVETINYLVKHTVGLQTVGSSHFQQFFAPCKEVPGPAIIKIQVTSGTNGMDVSAGFDLILVDN